MAQPVPYNPYADGHDPLPPVAADGTLHWGPFYKSAAIQKSYERLWSLGACRGTNKAITIRSEAELDVSAKAIGASLGMDNDVNIGAGVAVSVVKGSNTAFLSSSGSVLTGKGITIAAVTPASKSNEFITWAASAGGGKGDVGIAGSVAVHIVTFDTEASARSASALISNGGITVQAISKNEMQTLAAAGAFSQGTAIGLAVAIGVLNASSPA